MQIGRPSGVAAAMLAGLAAAPGHAHHSYAMFDPGQLRVATGTVAKLEWVNPHVFVWIYVPKAGGGHDLYGFETDPTSRLMAEGWTKASLPTGAKVTVEYAPLRDGRPGGALLRVRLPSGATLETRQSRRRP